MAKTPFNKSFSQSYLTHLSLVSFLWDIGKHHSPGCDLAIPSVTSGAMLFAQRNLIEKFTPNTPKIESGHAQYIMMGESICQIWVKLFMQSLA